MNEKEGIKFYNLSVKEIEERKFIESKKVKEWCNQEYDSYKKKYETSICNYSIYYDKIKVYLFSYYLINYYC